MNKKSVLFNASSQQHLTCSRLFQALDKIPDASTTGFCPGAMLINSNATTGSGAAATSFYVNRGTDSAPIWSSIYTVFT